MYEKSNTSMLETTQASSTDTLTKEFQTILTGLVASFNMEEQEVLDRVFSTSNEDNLSLNNTATQQVKQAFKHITDLNLQYLFYEFQYPFEKLLRSLVMRAYPGNKNLLFLIEHHSFVEMNFKRILEKIEGGSCCADKSRVRNC